MNYPEEGWTEYALIALVALTALWISLGSLQHFQNADSIIPVLVSLQHWTPFYWEANRYGMLVPLLAKPFHDPLANLIVQTGLDAFAALAASFLLLRYFFPNPRMWIAAAALQNIWLFLLVPKPIQFDWLVGQCYGVSLAVGLAGLILLDKRRWLTGLALIVLAHWVNFAVFLLLIPLVATRAWMVRNRNIFLLSGGFVGVGAIIGFFLMETTRFRTADPALNPVGMWTTGWLALAQQTWASMGLHPARLLWMIIPAVVGLGAVVLGHRQRKALLLVPAALIVTALLYWLMAGTLLWVRENGYTPRYVYPSLFLTSLALALLSIAPLESALNSNRVLPVASVFLMLVVAGATSGRPSAALVRRDLDQRFGAIASDVVASKADLVAGDYWVVWPTVFVANMKLHENHERRVVYSAVYRSLETFSLWQGRKNVCVAALMHDTEADRVVRIFSPPLRFTQARDTIEIFCER